MVFQLCSLHEHVICSPWTCHMFFSKMYFPTNNSPTMTASVFPRTIAHEEVLESSGRPTALPDFESFGYLRMENRNEDGFLVVCTRGWYVNRHSPGSNGKPLEALWKILWFFSFNNNCFDLSVKVWNNHEEQMVWCLSRNHSGGQMKSAGW